jgi:hypothetical protein
MGLDREFLTPTPHPDYGALTVREIQEDLARIESDLAFAKEHGAESIFVQWVVGERDLALRELARRNGQNLTSDYKESPSEVKFEREINAAELQRRAKEKPGPILTFLPLLGQERFIVKGWSHLLAAYPKAGKTELLVRVVAEWPEERVLYITEEAESAWKARLKDLPQVYDHVSLFYGLGLEPGEILDRIKAGQETVVILDTVRTLLGLEDENDNSKVARAIIPYVAAARTKQKTLIAVVHDRKGGGEHGEGIAGGHAFLGVIDIAIELLREPAKRRRRLRGWGRVVEVPELLYELQDDNTMIAIGSPEAVALREVKNRVGAALTDEWEKTKDVRDRLGDPKPSEDQILKALEALGREGKAERDPPIWEGKRQGARYKWRRAQNLTSDESSYRSEVKLDAEAKKEEGRWISEL